MLFVQEMYNIHCFRFRYLLNNQSLASSRIGGLCFYYKYQIFSS